MDPADVKLSVHQHWSQSCELTCYRLFHVVKAKGRTVLHSSYQTLASYISVRQKALSRSCPLSCPDCPPQISQKESTDYLAIW